MKSFMFYSRTIVLATFFAFASSISGGGSGFWSFFGAGPAEAATVNQIAVEGNQRVEATTIINYLTIEPGVGFGAADINDSVKSLYATGLFLDVGISQRASTLLVVVVENQVVNSVIFQGNKKVKSNILVTLVDTKSRGMLTEPQLQADARRIEGYYDQSGRSNAVVDPQVIQLDNNRVDVVFGVNEGGKTGVKTISFVGNQVYSDTRLRRVVQTRKSNWLSWLSKKDIYDPAKIDADEDLLRRFYMGNGFADFRVLATDVTFDDEIDKYHVVFTIEEGTRYRFGDVAIDSSIPDLDEKALYRQVKMKKGRVFDASLVERTIEELTVELSGYGFAFAEVRPRGDRDYENGTISITLLIDEGPRAYVERINIFGNTKTRDYVIRREFDLAEGDAYNRVLVDKAERRLRALGFFKAVAITTEPGSSPDKVIINVTVVDDSTGSFAVGGGYSTSDGIVGEASVTETNFLGRGQRLRVAYGLGETNSSYELSFTDPYFLGYRMSAGFDVYSRNTSSASDRPYDNEAIGGGIKFGMPITSDLKVTLKAAISNETISDVEAGGVASGTDATIYYTEGDSLTSSVGHTTVYSTIDNMANPSDGIYLKLAQDVAGLGGDVSYVRSTADARYYRELFYGTDIVGFVRVQGGNIAGLGQDVIVRDNFFKGGETVRGFAPYGIGARDVEDNMLGHDGLALGGKNFAAATAEVQFPIPILPSDFGLRGAVFADAGTLFGIDLPSGVSSAEVNEGASIRSSVGASVIWASPFGLLRGDFAYPVTKESHDETQVFRFSAGGQF